MANVHITSCFVHRIFVRDSWWQSPFRVGLLELLHFTKRLRLLDQCFEPLLLLIRILHPLDRAVDTWRRTTQAHRTFRSHSHDTLRKICRRFERAE